MVGQARSAPIFYHFLFLCLQRIDFADKDFPVFPFSFFPCLQRIENKGRIGFSPFGLGTVISYICPYLTDHCLSAIILLKGFAPLLELIFSSKASIFGFDSMFCSTAVDALKPVNRKKIKKKRIKTEKLRACLITVFGNSFLFQKTRITRETQRTLLVFDIFLF